MAIDLEEVGVRRLDQRLSLHLSRRCGVFGRYIFAEIVWVKNLNMNKRAKSFLRTVQQS